MPRTGPVRPAIAIKVYEEDIVWMDAEAERRGLLMASGRPNRSELVRQMYLYARQNMPSGPGELKLVGPVKAATQGITTPAKVAIMSGDTTLSIEIRLISNGN